MRFLDGVLGPGLRGQEAQAPQHLGSPRVSTAVCALLRGALARLVLLAANIARSSPAVGGDLHQRPDREFRDQSARLAGGRADRAAALAAGTAAALGNAEAQAPNRVDWSQHGFF